MWTISLGGQHIVQNQFFYTSWSNALILASLATTMIVNALGTGLIVLRIVKVFRKVKENTTAAEKSVGVTRGSIYRSIIFVIVESGMTLFAIQLARLVLVILPSNGNIISAYNLVVSIQEMLNVIVSSVIVTLYSTDNVALTRV